MNKIKIIIYIFLAIFFTILLTFLIIENSKIKKNVIKMENNIIKMENIINNISKQVDKNRVEMNKGLEEKSTKLKEIYKLINNFFKEIEGLNKKIYINSTKLKEINETLKNNSKGFQKVEKNSYYKKINNDYKKCSLVDSGKKGIKELELSFDEQTCQVTCENCNSKNEKNGLTWVVENEKGQSLLERNAIGSGNRFGKKTITYFRNFSGKKYYIYLKSFTNLGYRRISNIIEYKVN